MSNRMVIEIKNAYDNEELRGNLQEIIQTIPISEDALNETNSTEVEEEGVCTTKTVIFGDDCIDDEYDIADTQEGVLLKKAIKLLQNTAYPNTTSIDIISILKN